MQFLQLLKNILFPERCVVCKKDGVSLCTTCLEKLPHYPHGPHDFIYPLFSYHNAHVKKVIHALKYNHTYSLLEHVEQSFHELAEIVFEQHIILNRTSCIVIPVPEMKSHTRRRGGNHVALLAERLAEQLHIPYIDRALIRTNTVPQRTLSRQERLVNMENGFQTVDKNMLKHKTIILVDDVVTTGATLVALRTECMSAGASHVYALTLAH